MRIIALWDRRKVAPKSRSVFALLEDGRFLDISPDKEYQGTDANGKRIYKDTGFPDISPAYKEHNHFDFSKADFFIRHFGGELIVEFEKISGKEERC